jgi:serine/threonine protein kinase
MDFGLAIVIDSQVARSAPADSAGTPRWQAPELLLGFSDETEHHGRESDIYAFACVCYEVAASFRVPYSF